MSAIAPHHWGENRGDRGSCPPSLWQCPPSPAPDPGWIFSSYEEEKTNKHPDPPPRPQLPTVAQNPAAKGPQVSNLSFICVPASLRHAPSW